jgi:hypothetical protein
MEDNKPTMFYCYSCDKFMPIFRSKYHECLEWVQVGAVNAGLGRQPPDWRANCPKCGRHLTCEAKPWIPGPSKK